MWPWWPWDFQKHFFFFKCTDPKLVNGKSFTDLVYIPKPMPKSVNWLLVKAAVRFFLFVAISVRNLQLQSFAELSTLRDTAQGGWTKCLRKVCSCQSPRRCRYWHSESRIIRLRSMTNIRIHAKLCKLYFVLKLFMLTTSALCDYM